MKDHYMCSLRDGCYKQLENASRVQQNQKTDDRTACSFRSNSCITVCFQLKAEKIIIIINN